MRATTLHLLVTYTRFSPTSSVSSPWSISFSRRDFDLSASGSSCASAKQAWAGGKLGAASSRQETVELKSLKAVWLQSTTEVLRRKTRRWSRLILYGLIG